MNENIRLLGNWKKACYGINWESITDLENLKKAKWWEDHGSDLSQLGQGDSK